MNEATKQYYAEMLLTRAELKAIIREFTGSQRTLVKLQNLLLNVDHNIKRKEKLHGLKGTD